MVSFKDRIDRMLADGKLTAAQAKSMFEGISTLEASPARSAHAHYANTDVSCRKKFPIGLTALAGGALLVVLMIAFGGNGTEQDVIQNVSETLNQSGGVGAMNKNLMMTISIFVLVMPVVLIFMFLYNNLVSKEEDVMSAWAQVEANYQRRADLIPNLIETVKATAQHESEILTAVTESRAKALSIIANPDNQDSVDAMIEAQAALGQNLTRLLATVENYPQLRSMENFLALQDQLEGTENRINVSRMVFNESVGDYNAAIRKMPGAMVASFGDFKRKAYFKSDEGAENAVPATFGNTQQ